MGTFLKATTGVGSFNDFALIGEILSAVGLSPIVLSFTPYPPDAPTPTPPRHFCNVLQHRSFQNASVGVSGGLSTYTRSSFPSMNSTADCVGSPSTLSTMWMIPFFAQMSPSRRRARMWFTSMKVPESSHRLHFN